MSPPLESDDQLSIVASVDAPALVLPSVVAAEDPFSVVPDGHPGAMNTVSENDLDVAGVAGAENENEKDGGEDVLHGAEPSTQAGQPKANVTLLCVSRRRV